MKKLITLLFACNALIISAFAVTATANEHAHSSIQIEQPWSRPTPPGTSMGVGYLLIKNHSNKDVRLVGANTPRAGQVSIHETLMKDGVMRMRPVKSGLIIPAGGLMELKPHSYHLMLEELSSPLAEGERIPLTLNFEEAGSIAIELNVQSLDADTHEMDMEHSGHDMGH